MEEAEFRRHVEKQGYGEPELREYEPNLSGELHSHEFSAMLLVMRGTFSLALEKESINCLAGEIYQVPAGVLHDERTGSNGATILLAKK